MIRLKPNRMIDENLIWKKSPQFISSIFNFDVQYHSIHTASLNRSVLYLIFNRIKVSGIFD